MSKFTVTDLSEVVTLDNSDLREVVGGWIRRTYSTADLHKSIYGDASPYGRNPASWTSSTFSYKAFSG